MDATSNMLPQFLIPLYVRTLHDAIKQQPWSLHFNTFHGNHLRSMSLHCHRCHNNFYTHVIQSMASKGGVISWGETPMNACGFAQLPPIQGCHLLPASCPPHFAGSLFNGKDVTYTRNDAVKILSENEEVEHKMLVSFPSLIKWTWPSCPQSCPRKSLTQTTVRLRLWLTCLWEWPLSGLRFLSSMELLDLLFISEKELQVENMVCPTINPPPPFTSASARLPITMSRK